MKEQEAGHRWVEDLLRPVLIAAMMICLAAPFVGILAWIIPEWDSAYFLVFCFLAGLEGILSERVLRQRRLSGLAYLGSRAAELLILLILLKVVNYIPLGLDQLLADAQDWVTNPYELISFLDLMTGILFAALWLGAVYVGRQASKLDASAGKTAPPSDRSSTEYYLWLTQPPVAADRQAALDGLGELFIWGGIALLAGSAILHFAIPEGRVPALPSLLYFGLGVALLSQARFSVSRAGWQVQGIPIQQGIGRRWLIWAIVFLVGISLLAMLLPTRYAMGPIQAIYSLIGIIGQVVLFLITLITYLIALLLSLVLPGRTEPPRPEVAPPQPLAPAQQPIAGSPPWLDIVMSVLFWAVILTIVGYALVRFLRDRLGEMAEQEGAEKTWWGRILTWLRDLVRQWRAWRGDLQERIDRRRAARREQRAAGTRLPWLISLRGLPPRDLIRYFYLSAARRAAQAGQARKAGQTPHEYQVELESQFPDLEPDLSGLTDAFVQARYNYRPVHKEEAEAVKPLWQRIKSALRRRRTGD